MVKPELFNAICSDISEPVSTKKYYQDRIFTKQFKTKAVVEWIEQSKTKEMAQWVEQSESKAMIQRIEPFKNKIMIPLGVALGVLVDVERWNQSLIGIENEIDKANNFLISSRSDVEYSEISESIWNFTKNGLRKIYNHRFNFEPPFPKIIFIENSIELRWEKTNKYKLVLKDIIVYIKEKGMSPLSGSICKDRIIDWVLFWINQFRNY